MNNKDKLEITTTCIIQIVIKNIKINYFFFKFKTQN